MIKVAKIKKENNPFIEEFFMDGSGYYELIKIDVTNSKENALNKIKLYLQEAQNQNILKNFDTLLKKKEKTNNSMLYIIVLDKNTI